MSKGKPMCCGMPMMATYRYKKFGVVCQDFICAKCGNKVYEVELPRSDYEASVR